MSKAEEITEEITEIEPKNKASIKLKDDSTNMVKEEQDSEKRSLCSDERPENGTRKLG